LAKNRTSAHSRQMQTAPHPCAFSALAQVKKCKYTMVNSAITASVLAISTYNTGRPGLAPRASVAVSTIRWPSTCWPSLCGMAALFAFLCRRLLTPLVFRKPTPHARRRSVCGTWPARRLSERKSGACPNHTRPASRCQYTPRIIYQLFLAGVRGGISAIFQILQLCGPVRKRSTRAPPPAGLGGKARAIGGRPNTDDERTGY
jgi:hypothetical protein